MAAFVDKVKSITGYFLGTQDDKYILTELGLKIVLVDFSAVDKTKNVGVWWLKSKLSGVWGDKPQNVGTWSSVDKNIGSWSDKSKII